MYSIWCMIFWYTCIYLHMPIYTYMYNICMYVPVHCIHVAVKQMDIISFTILRTILVLYIVGVDACPPGDVPAARLVRPDGGGPAGAAQAESRDARHRHVISSHESDLHHVTSNGSQFYSTVSAVISMEGSHVAEAWIWPHRPT